MNDRYSGTFYKVTTRDEIHHGFSYQDGENVLIEPFAEEGSCCSGGLYFTDKTNLHNFLSYGVWIREITLPLNDERLKVVADPSGDKYRANILIFGKRYSLLDPDTFTKFDLPMSRCYQKLQEYITSNETDVEAYENAFKTSHGARIIFDVLKEKSAVESHGDVTIKFLLENSASVEIGRAHV